MTSIKEQIQFCEQMKSVSAHAPMFRAISQTLTLAEKMNLIPDKVDGSTYQRFVDSYFAFREGRGSTPRMTPASGKALKDVIQYLLKNKKVEGDPAKAHEAFAFILANWNHLSDYIRQQVALTQINKNIEEIIEQLTNASKKAKQQHNQSEKQRLKDAIKNG